MQKCFEVCKHSIASYKKFRLPDTDCDSNCSSTHLSTLLSFFVPSISFLHINLPPLILLLVTLFVQLFSPSSSTNFFSFFQNFEIFYPSSIPIFFFFSPYYHFWSSSPSQQKHFFSFFFRSLLTNFLSFSLYFRVLF